MEGSVGRERRMGGIGEGRDGGRDGRSRDKADRAMVQHGSLIKSKHNAISTAL